MPARPLALHTIGGLGWSVREKAEPYPNGVGALGVLTFAVAPWRSKIWGVCETRWIFVTFSPFYPWWEEKIEPAKAQVFANGYDVVMRYEVIDPLGRPGSAAAEEAAAFGRQCAERPSALAFFSAPGPEAALQGAQAIEQVRHALEEDGSLPLPCDQASSGCASDRARVARVIAGTLGSFEVRECGSPVIGEICATLGFTLQTREANHGKLIIRYRPTTGPGGRRSVELLAIEAVESFVIYD